MQTLTIDHINAVVQAVRDDEALYDDLKAQRTSLAREIALNPNAGKEIVSSSDAGTSVTSEITFTKADRLAFLQRVIDHIDNDITPANKTYARF